jgi:hypothetical protein
VLRPQMSDAKGSSYFESSSLPSEGEFSTRPVRMLLWIRIVPTLLHSSVAQWQSIRLLTGGL